MTYNVFAWDIKALHYYYLCDEGRYLCVCMCMWVHGRTKASVGSGAVPNLDPLQTYNQYIKIFHCHQLRTHKIAGPGAAAPLAPP